MKYAVVGMGKSGDSARALLGVRGVLDSDILTFDDKPGKGDTTDAKRILALPLPATLVISPGYPLSTPWIQVARDRGFRVTSELALAVETLKNEKVVGVTGSVGKSTTVALLQEGLAAFTSTFFVGGNFGTPLSDYAVSVERGGPRADWIVLELSSFQLENAGDLALDVSAVTSLTSNHLERYDSRDHYFATKWTLLERTKGVCFVNAASPELSVWADSHPGPWRKVSSDDAVLRSLHLENRRLLGRHNLDNLAVAVSIALEAGWPRSSIEAMKRYAGLPHRLENAGVLSGVSFINDSKATTIDSVTTAVNGISAGDGALWILVGGRDKKLPWRDLGLLKSPLRRFVFFGECGELAKSESGLEGPIFGKLGGAVDHVFECAQAGDVVLLSPGGSSLDEFGNFELRGEFFKEKIRTRASSRPS